MKYTEEQIKEIGERVEKANAFLAENNLRPAAFVQKVPIGDDVFVDKIGVYLQDTKYDLTEEENK